MSEDFRARIKHKRDTSANWTQNNPVILNGEIIIVDTDNGVRIKVGDGVKKYTQLPFDDELLRSLIDEKVPISQGVSEAGKVLSVDTSGDVTLRSIQGSNGISVDITDSGISITAADALRGTTVISEEGISTIAMPIVPPDSNALVVYQNGLLLTPDTNYTVLGGSISLVDYTAEVGDIFTFISSAALVNSDAIKGDKGETGATPNIQVGTVTTLDAGSNATVNITGTAENPVVNFGIPKGDPSLPVDDEPTLNSENPVSSNGVKVALSKCVPQADTDVIDSLQRDDDEVTMENSEFSVTPVVGQIWHDENLDIWRFCIAVNSTDGTSSWKKLMVNGDVASAITSQIATKQDKSTAITTSNISSQTVNKAKYATGDIAVGTAALRNQYFVSAEATPTVNGQIAWVYG